MSTSDDNTNLQYFARLSELQFDLNQHRDRLLVKDGLVAVSLPEVPGLDSALGTIDRVREVVDGIMRREDLRPLVYGNPWVYIRFLSALRPIATYLSLQSMR